MKFSNGQWLQQAGTECFGPAQFFETGRSNNSITFTASTHKIRHRGDTLGGPNLTIKISSPAQEVLRVQTWHYMGLANHGPEFELNIDQESQLDIQENDNFYELKSGTLKIVINKESAEMTFYRGEYKLTASGFKDLAYVKTDYTGIAYEKDNKDAYMREQLSLSVGELIYGLGERFTPFVKNGQTVDIWNEDGGTSCEQSYKNIPFYLSNRGYAVFVNSPSKVSYEIGSEQVKKVGFSVQGESLDYFFFNGPTMKEALVRYTDLTGKPSMPPAWSFGLWLSTSFTTQYDEATVTSFVNGMEERGIPLSVFHFDCFWMKGFNWSDFKWDKEVFPDPAGMLKRLKAKGLKICVWINSYIAQESVLFEEGKKNGYFIKRTNGDVWQWDMWQPGMAVVDFTNPAACDWFSSKLEELMDMGVDCFKTDFGERIPSEDVVYYNGADPVGMHNYYTFLYNKTVYDLLVRKKGKEEAVVFARSATVGGQKFPVHWGGDCWSNFESMSESLRGGLSLTMSGFGYWSHDIGGFEDTSTPDVYKRWVAFGLMSSHSRLHGSTSYRVPWAYDEESVEVARFFTRLKASFMPYLYRNAIFTSKTGIPVMRSMVIEFENDPACGYLDKQYMFGDSLLVSPIFNPEGNAEYYLPSGIWTNYLTGEEVQGGRFVKEHHDYLSIPCMVREGSILAVNEEADRTEYDYEKNLTLKIYALKDNVTAETKVYNKDGECCLKIQAKKDGDKINILLNSLKTEATAKIYLHHVTDITSITGARAESLTDGTMIFPDCSTVGTTEIKIAL